MRSTAKIAAAIAIVAACACSKQGNEGRGRINLRIDGIDMNVADVTKSSVSDYCEVPTIEDMTLSIYYNKAQMEVFRGSISNLDQSETYLIGEYTATLSYGSEGEEGLGKARFYGETDYRVYGAESVDVNLTAALANTIIKVQYSESFKQYFKDDQLKIVTGSNNTIDITDGSIVFIEAFRFTVQGSVKNPQNVTQTFEKVFDGEIQPKTCYIMTIDATNIGSAAITITFNDEVQTVDLGDVEINDKN